jgi:glycosyltransferase involved in cell wall biosynthesis
MSIAQAQAAGRLVVATDAGGCRHMISSGESGVIVPIGDHEALGKALIERIKDQPGSMLMRRKTREDAFVRYRADVIARKTADFYREILAAA